MSSVRYRQMAGALLLFTFCIGAYCLMAYGGIRSPDGEIIFRTGEALAANGSMALKYDLAAWRGFGVARGLDGQLYTGYAPGQSILMVPMIKLAMKINRSRWFETETFSIPISFAVSGDSLKDYIHETLPEYPEKHALRFLVSFFTPLVSAFVMVVFFFIVRQLVPSLSVALTTTLLLALATPFWSYSGTMFREPLTMLWTLISFYCLMRNAASDGEEMKGYLWLAGAGLFIGLGFFVHLRAVLFVPFFLVYGVYPSVKTGKGMRRIKKGLAAALVFTGGFSVFAAVFCWLNYARFGHILKTGRLISPVTYGTFVSPWEGLSGLLVSPGKGLLWYCPIVLVCLIWWRRLHVTNRLLSWVLANTIVFHWVFLACRSDWHGGFCLGPRYLMPVVPFLLLPVATFLSEQAVTDHQQESGRWGRRLWALFFLACIVQQIYFCLGEPISFYYLIKQHYLERGVSIISDNRIYFNWRASPLLFLLEARRGPFLLQHIPLGNYSLLALISLLAALLTKPVMAVIRKFD